MGPVNIWQKIGAGIFLVCSVGVWIFVNITLAGKESGRRYYTLLHQSVRGLAPSSMVSYNGIPIGKVVRVSNDFDHNQVRVDILITDPNAKIFADIENSNQENIPGTRATLITSLVTSLQYVDLTGGGKKHPELPVGSEIPSLDSGFNKMSWKLEKVIDKIHTIISKKNIQHFSNFLANLDQISQNLNTSLSLENKSSFISQIQKILLNLEKLSGKKNQRYLESFLYNLVQSTDPKNTKWLTWLHNMQNQVSYLLKNLSHLVQELREVIYSENKGGIRRLLQDFDLILTQNQKDIRQTFINLRELSSLANHHFIYLIQDVRTTVKSLNYFLTKELPFTIREFQKTLQDISRMLKVLRAKPNALLWGSKIRGSK